MRGKYWAKAVFGMLGGRCTRAIPTKGCGVCLREKIACQGVGKRGSCLDSGSRVKREIVLGEGVVNGSITETDELLFQCCDSEGGGSSVCKGGSYR